MSIFDVLKILYCEFCHTYHIQPTNQPNKSKQGQWGISFLTCDTDLTFVKLLCHSQLFVLGGWVLQDDISLYYLIDSVTPEGRFDGLHHLTPCWIFTACLLFYDYYFYKKLCSLFRMLAVNVKHCGELGKGSESFGSCSDSKHIVFCCFFLTWVIPFLPSPAICGICPLHVLPVQLHAAGD